MPVGNKPYDATNSSNPWLLNKSNHPAIMGPWGEKLTAEYIWSLQGEKRIELVEWLIKYYRQRGFPYFKLSDKELQEEYSELCKKDPKCVFENGVIKNSNTCGLNIAKHFTSDLFSAAKGGPKTKSCIEVFNNDELLRRVLKNRMGWNTSKEDGTERPYIFGMNDLALVTGMRSSGLAYSVSHFKPLIAKFIYDRYNVKKTIDFSCGWGSRCSAALSLGIEYYGVDPLTAERNNDIIKYFGGKGLCFPEASESFDYSAFPDVDMCWSCGPYENLEVYDESEKQSSHYKTYEDWLSKYWEETVKRCVKKCNYFSFVIVEKVGKHNIMQDMCKICCDIGIKEVEQFSISVGLNHLSAKAKTGKTTKKTEHLIVYKV